MGRNFRGGGSTGHVVTVWYEPDQKDESWTWIWRLLLTGFRVLFYKVSSRRQELSSGNLVWRGQFWWKVDTAEDCYTPGKVLGLSASQNLVRCASIHSLSTLDDLTTLPSVTCDTSARYLDRNLAGSTVTAFCTKSVDGVCLSCEHRCMQQGLDNTPDRTPPPWDTIGVRWWWCLRWFRSDGVLSVFWRRYITPTHD